MSWAVFSLAIALALSACQPARFSYAPGASPDETLGTLSPAAKSEIKIELQRAALRYFLENAHPETGLVRDKALSAPTLNDDQNVMASISATGFGIAAIAHASTQGWVGREVAKAYFDKVMRTCQNKLQRQHGWFLHFIDWRTGRDGWWDFNDYSSIDSTFLSAGALYAAQIFPGSEGARIAHELYRDLDFWWMMTDNGKYPTRRTLSLGYSPVRGFSDFQWSNYAEQSILLVLGLGHPNQPLPPETWHGWNRRLYRSQGFEGVALDMPLFVHQYPQLFLDLRQFKDGYPNYFRNSQTATRFNRYVAAHQRRYPLDGFWGFSAGAAPDEQSKSVYRVNDPFRHDGTVCMACVIGSAQFDPELVLSDAQTWRHGPLADKIWGRYGFVDGVNLEKNWFAPETYGITAGAAYLSLANTDDETSIWRVFNQIPEIRKGLAVAGQQALLSQK